MKVKIVSSLSSSGFEYNIEFYINQLINEGNEIIDIKFGGAVKKQVAYGIDYEYSAMIIYK